MKLRAITIAIVLAVGALAWVAWKNNTAPAGGPPASAPAEVPSVAPPAGGTGNATNDPGVSWQPPKRWVQQLASGMRLATYIVPAPKPGAPDAECAVYYFGPDQGGGVEPNIARWVGEFENPGAPARATRNVGAFAISRVFVRGRYVAHGMSADAPSTPRKDWALIGAIAQGPTGSIFFKLTGPARTVAAAADEFDAMLGSLVAKTNTHAGSAP